MGWITPVLRDNWGHQEVFLGQYAMTSAGTMASEAGVPKLLPGLHKIRWPDGTEEEAEIHTKTYRREVWDHGHSTPVESEIPCLWINHKGTKIELEIMETGCDLWLEISG